MDFGRPRKSLRKPSLRILSQSEQKSPIWVVRDWLLLFFSRWVRSLSGPGSSVYRNFPGKNTGVGCHFLLQRIFLTQESNSGLLHWQADSLPLIQTATSLLILNTPPLYLRAFAFAISATVFLQIAERLAPSPTSYMLKCYTTLEAFNEARPHYYTHTLLIPYLSFLYSNFSIWLIKYYLFICIASVFLTWEPCIPGV